MLYVFYAIVSYWILVTNPQLISKINSIDCCKFSFHRVLLNCCPLGHGRFISGTDQLKVNDGIYNSKYNVQSSHKFTFHCLIMFLSNVCVSIFSLVPDWALFIHRHSMLYLIMWNAILRNGVQQGVRCKRYKSYEQSYEWIATSIRKGIC